MQLSPKKILEPERFLLYEGSDNSLIVPIILNLIKKDNTSICDVGGASGKLLKEIVNKSNFKIKPVIMDIDDFYQDKICNYNIEFLNESVLNNKLDDNHFDIIIFRHLLHHLISNNLKNTIKIQKLALDEIFRITKRNGYVIFLEQVNNNKLFSWIIYLLSKLANKLEINIKLFYTGKVIVHFLSYNYIKKLLGEFKKKYNLRIYRTQYFHWKLSLKWRITLLMSNVGSVFYIIKVLK